MRCWDAERIALAAGARLVAGGRSGTGPERATIDSRKPATGALFVGLPGSRTDGGDFAAAALAEGAWGAIVGPDHAGVDPSGGALLVSDDPLGSLQQLATAWRRELGCRVIAITGSTGKTSTKDLTAAMVGQHLRTVATPENLNTEIGLPLVVLSAPAGTEVLVLEMAMRGAGQIAELTAIAEPDVGVIVNVGPVHLELLGSIERIAAAKAELLAGLAPGRTAIVPAGEVLLDVHLRADLHTVTFGPGGDVDELPAGIVLHDGSAHTRVNALAALAAARAVGVEPQGRIEVRMSALRGQRIALPGGSVVINDCYNANPMSMRAALDELSRSAGGRRLAVLGDMLELGPGEVAFHERLGEQARDAGVDLLLTVGPLAAHALEPFGGPGERLPDAAAAAERVAGLVESGDTILVKGSRGVGLEVVAERLAGQR